MAFLGSMPPQYMALFVCFVSFVCFVCPKKLVCPFVGLHCGFIPPIRVSVQLVTLWGRPPLVCVLSLEDNLHCHWIIACCLLRFAAFLVKWLVKKEFGVDKNSRSVNKFWVNDKFWIPVWKKFWVWKRFLGPKQSLGPKKFWAPNNS